MEQKNIALKISATLIVILMIAMLLLCAFSLSATTKTLPASITVSESSLHYSVGLQQRFYRSFRLFFSGVAEQNELFDGMITNFYNTFSVARIPTEKVEWFLTKVEQVPTDNNPMYAFLTQKMTKYEELRAAYEASLGTPNELAEPTYRDVISAQEMQLGMRKTFDFIMSSPLTNDEIGRVFYRTVLTYSAGTDYAELIKKVGEADITMLTVGSYMVFQNVQHLTSIQNLGTARAVGQSLVSLGSSYLSLTKKLGLKEVDRLFGFDYRIAENETNGLVTGELIPYYNALLETLAGYPGGFLVLLGNVLTEVAETTFDELYLAELAKADGREAEYRAHRVFAAVEVAKTVRRGMETAKANSEKMYQTDQEIAEFLAKGYTASIQFSDIMNSDLAKIKDTAHYERCHLEAKKELDGALSAIKMLGDFGEYQDILNLQQQNPQMFLEGFQYAEALFGFNFQQAGGMADLFTGLLFNVFVRLLQSQNGGI